VGKNIYIYQILTILMSKLMKFKIDLFDNNLKRFMLKHLLRFFCFVLLGVSWHSLQSAEPRAAGTVSRLRGDVFVYRKQEKLSLQQNDRLFEGDMVETLESGRVRIVLSEGSNEIVLAASTRMRLEKVGGASRNRQGTQLELQQGSVRTQVKRQYSGIEKDVFEIRTQATVAGVRGTTFMMSFEPKGLKTILATEKGLVDLRAGDISIGVAAGSFIIADGRRMGPSDLIKNNKAIQSTLQQLRDPNFDDNEGLDDSLNSSSTNSHSTEFALDADGNEVVIERQNSNTDNRSPASLNNEMAENDSAPAPQSIQVDRKIAESGVNPNASVPMVDFNRDTQRESDLKDQLKSIQNSTDFPLRPGSMRYKFE
jgi:hypothetical protein